MTRSFVMHKIWKTTLDHQSLEIEKAIYNQRNNFRLASQTELLSVNLKGWINMSRQNKEIYIQQLDDE